MIKLVLTLLVSICFSCSAQSHDGKSPSVAQRTPSGQADLAQIEKPDMVVREFMAFISLGDKDKANELMEPEVNVPVSSANLSRDEIHTGIQTVPRLDWVMALTERKYRLVEIVEERTDGDKSRLTVAFGVPDLEKFREYALFHLTKVNGRWLISDLELLGGKRPVPSHGTGGA